MPHYVGLDASKATTSVCVIDENGEIVKEGSVPTEPAAIVRFLRGEGRRYRRIGIESISFAPWIYQRLARDGLPIVCIEALHAHGVLKARVNKTDRNDARGIAELMRSGVYKAVHIKTPASQNAKAVLAARALLRLKCRDVDNMIRGLLLQFGFKLSAGRPTSFEARARGLAAKAGALCQVIAALIETRAFLMGQIKSFDGVVDELVSNDPVCVRLMTAPGVGPLAALAYRSAIDVPERFTNSRTVAVHLGLTPRVWQSGSTERSGRISKHGDRAARAALFLAARAVISRVRTGHLRDWGREVAARRGYMRGIVAVARKLAVILHRIWITGDVYRPIATS